MMFAWGAPSFSAGAQRVTLRVRPPVGDTLWMTMDQTFEMADDSTHSSAAPQAMSAKVRVCTHTIVLNRAKNGTEVESVTDSVNITPDIVTTIPLFANVRRALNGRHVHLRITEDGALQILGDPASATPGAVSMAMPPMLPDQPVAVGQTWTRELPVPISGAQTSGGLVHATFRLDSLSADQNIAYISMKGTLAHPASAKDGSKAARPAMVGTLVGTMQIDRRLEWMTDSRATITFNSLVRLSRDTAPVWVRMKVTQWLRAVPAP
jgi:hypothetical protein